MQNLDSNKENTNPDHFLNTCSTNPAATTLSSNNPKDIDNFTDLEDPKTSTTSGATRPKFSFASDYTPSRHYNALSASYDYSSNLSLTVPSFAVLNNDYASSSTLFSHKPNAIVHPIRRPEQAALPKSYNGLERELRVNGYNPSLPVTYPQLSAGGTFSNARHFAEELNRKLSHLSSSQGSRDFKNASQHGSNQDTLNQRPLFITTVPRGIFLPPPKDIVLLSPSRKRQLYAYSSHPVVYNATTTSSTLPTSYYNNTHIGHKVKGTSEQNYNNNIRNTVTMAKDKYHNNNNKSGGAGGEAGGGGGGGVVGNIANDGESNAIALNDKGLTASTTNNAPNTKTSLQLNGVRGSYANSTPVPGGLHITKQQFHQQLKQNRSKRETPPPEPYKNVMHERRIVRGSNYATNQLMGEYDPFDRAAEYRRRQALRKKNVTQRNQRNVLGTPPPVEGRRHEDVQTDKYLEELIAKPTETSTETQTDLFLEKPPTPPYIPAKIGVDKATEIADGELFQFEAEAQPIIDVMVDSIMELSILEVAHEQEIAAIRKKQQDLLAERETELAELRRLEEEEVRLQAEKERRLRQDSIAKSLDEEMQRGITAAKLLQGHIASILPEVLDSLEPATDAAKKEQLMKTIYPWLTVEVAEEVGQIVDSREILTVIIQEIIKQRAETYAGYKEETPAKLPDINEEEQTAEGEMCETEEEQEPHQPRCPPDVS
ncbi:radial spoke head protein 3 [Cochliomyia hominivorax]